MVGCLSVGVLRGFFALAKKEIRGRNGEEVVWKVVLFDSRWVNIG